MVLKCWRGFLFPQELEEFGQTIIECSTDEPSHSMDFIHQSVASDTPNDKQKSEAGCSYEDLYPGRLRRHLYLEQIIRNNIYFEDQWNIVSTVNLDCKLDLKAIALQARIAEYNPKRFAAVIMRIREPKTTALIFASGKMVCTRAKSEQQLKLAARKYARIIQKLGLPAKFKDLRLLPELPLNIRNLEAGGCASLETLTLRLKDGFCPGLSLIDCDKLFKNRSFSDMFSTMLPIPIPDYLGWGKFIIPGREIPKWFSYQSEGTSLNLQGPLGFTGIAVCVVLIMYPHPSSHVPPLEGYTIACSCFVDGTISLGFGTDVFFYEFSKIGSCHLWIRYFPLKRKRGKELSQIKLEIRHSGPGLVVTKCGARLLYEQDIEDLKEKMPGSSSCSITPYEDNLDDSAKDTKIKQSQDDFEGDGAGPSGEGTSNEVDEPQPKWIHITL